MQCRKREKKRAMEHELLAKAAVEIFQNGVDHPTALCRTLGLKTFGVAKQIFIYFTELGYLTKSAGPKPKHTPNIALDELNTAQALNSPSKDASAGCGNKTLTVSNPNESHKQKLINGLYSLGSLLSPLLGRESEHLKLLEDVIVYIENEKSFQYQEALEVIKKAVESTV